MGRFIGEDPIGFFGGINFYAYAENNPTTLIDLFGLGAIKEGVKDKLRKELGPHLPKDLAETIIDKAAAAFEAEADRLGLSTKIKLVSANPLLSRKKRESELEKLSQPVLENLKEKAKEDAELRETQEALEKAAGEHSTCPKPHI